ncbi:protein translocase subunit SecD [Brotaphodocola sp.]|uniref:protein translocase subunit SecD n=1 Tax=Brotaphodocola sp. TaxID=3073577 RepID=UPI003D7F094F
MKSSKTKGLIGLLILLVAVVGFGFLGYKTVGDVKLGLDLAGGVSITYQAVEDNPSSEEMSDTIYKLQQRVQNYSTEAEVYQEGSNRINIDIPGVSDANAILEELGKPGSLTFTDESGNVLLTGDQVATAKAGIIDQKNGQKSYVVSLTFTDEGTKTFADATTANVGKRIAIIYDGQVYSAPVVREAITGGQCQIDGMASYEEAENLASTIRIGSLSLELEELRSNVVGAKLGQEAISTSLKAGAVGFAILVVFMLAVYLLPGLAAVIALTLYVGLVVLLLAAFEVTLTLPGIAGIILSVGMAVDANVIIFTRIKEEIGLGHSVQQAIKAGFAKALSAIVDGNVTTLIAAVVLYFRGSGTVKGFATTLAIGIVLSMFTALVVTRGALYAFYALGLQSPKLYGSKTTKKIYNVLKIRKAVFALSVLILVAGGVGMGINNSQTGHLFHYSMDFTGGTSTSVTFNEEMSLEDISTKVVPVVEKVTGDADVQTQKVAGTNEVIIKTKTLNVDQRQALEEELVNEFGVDGSKITAESISGAVSTEMKRDAAVALAIAGVLMLLYIWARFRDIRLAASSVIALMHDVLVVVSCYALFKWSVGSTFIACVLTIVGYSINATIVIFDRIRENLAIQGKRTLEEVVNTSITETLTRSINTSLTTFVMVLALYIMGVSSIREFALPLMVGVVCGTYSSVCLSGSLWYELTVRKNKKVAEAKAAAKKAKAKK